MKTVSERLAYSASGKNGLWACETCAEGLDEIQRLQGEAGVMRGLLKQCAGIILTIDSENDTESEMLDDLHEKIVLAIRGGA